MQARELADILMKNPDATVVILSDGDICEVIQENSKSDVSEQGKFNFSDAPMPSPYLQNPELYENEWVDITWGREASGQEPIEIRTIIELGF